MTRIIAIANQKGGVGKTTTAINLVSALAHAGYRGLLIDMDPQGNATVGCGVAVGETEASIYEVLLGEADMADTVIRASGGFRVLPSHPDLSGAQVELNVLDRREHRLGAALATIIHEYDNVLIDCPPVLNILTVNALTAAREVLIPVQCEYLALEGLASLMKTIRLVREGLNPNWKSSGWCGPCSTAGTPLPGRCRSS